MTEFWLATEWFVWGFAIGWICNPVWQILKKIWHEAKLARDEWGRPRG